MGGPGERKSSLIGPSQFGAVRLPGASLNANRQIGSLVGAYMLLGAFVALPLGLLGRRFGDRLGIQ